MRKAGVTLTVLLFALAILLSYEAVNEIQAQTEGETGILGFKANGEDFIRAGFVSKDGWNISFEKVLVNLTEITAYQTEPPFVPEGTDALTGQVTTMLPGTYLVDLAAGDETAAPIAVGEVVAGAGQYNAVSWQMIPAREGEAAGYSLLMAGTAEKEGETVEFSIGIPTGYSNECGEYVGDERKGILMAGGTADLELTFHFDHVFGDGELPADDGLNVSAVGFEPFAATAEAGTLETDLTTLETTMSAEAYQMLVDILPTLGHTGEGHCFYGETGILGFKANGEDFIRAGFVSKDGWNISFEKVLVNLTEITAYQTEPPFVPEGTDALTGQVTTMLPGTYLVDLAAGDETAAPIAVGEVVAGAGQYNAVSWQMIPAREGEAAGYSLLMAGTAEKEGETVEFSIGIPTGYSNECGEYVGDERKGILMAGGEADLELTFHFDHIFGDGELPADDGLNVSAVGFEPFMVAAEGGKVETDLAALAEAMTAEEYQMLVDILPTLGHTGEGHCRYQEIGTLQFKANGEDFIRQGFTSKDGWTIAFDQVLVNLSQITAYQANPPYEPAGTAGLLAQATANLSGTYVIDLAAGDETADPIPVGEVYVPAGQYNAVSWQMLPATEGDMAGYSLWMAGTAEKEGETIDFTIGVENPYYNTCGEFVGDERKGILTAGGTADLELTFHFDHVFGDGELPADDGLNVSAVGFEPFAATAEAGTLETDLTTLETTMSAEAYQMLVDILPTLGHTGEGHCFYGETGILGFKANGEDFIRAGFVSKDGWNISFEKVLVNLTEITAYQTEPPFVPEGTDALTGQVTTMLPGTYLVDLAAGDETAAPIAVGEVVAGAGQYNAVSWQMIPAREGEAAGYSLLMAGTAEKEGETVEFSIGIPTGYSNECGEYVGDERKGILMAGGEADLELTFHFDHIFGDGELPADDGLNVSAVGFEPFMVAAEGGKVETDLAALAEAMTAEEYQMLVDILPTLGHTGEGHCRYVEIQ